MERKNNDVIHFLNSYKSRLQNDKNNESSRNNKDCIEDIITQLNNCIYKECNHDWIHDEYDVSGEIVTGIHCTICYLTKPN